MILTPDSDVKAKEIGQQSDVIVNRAEAVTDDPPPAYSRPSPAPGSAATNTPNSPLPPDSVKPTNFLSLHRSNTPIKGVYVIDPTIKIPPPMLPPLAQDETEATRRNVYLQTSNGTVDVELFVVAGTSGGNEVKQKVNMFVRSSNGAIITKLHAGPIPSRPPINLTALTSNGSVNIHLPRSFRGPLTIRTRNGSIRFSDALNADLTTFNEVNQTRRCFIGDFADWTEEGWAGDEVSIESSNGSIRLQYDAESPSDAGSKGSGKSKGLFARLLGA
ncbi:hypothetical protein R3P38DRAFT_2873838 [Favolaschia claudopus]|uniref:DUF7330 domain-containing protein n=1 Tax=Favolaschia claudopus TaxID=2862362 RepID=A0AAW0D1P1_9AGAR